MWGARLVTVQLFALEGKGPVPGSDIVAERALVGGLLVGTDLNVVGVRATVPHWVVVGL